MRHSKALFGAAMALAITACSNPQYLIHPTSNPAAAETRQQLDYLTDTTSFQPLRWGSFLFPAKGSLFKPVLATDSRNAVVYVYRPQSSWNDAEVQSPGFFINGQFVSGLKSGAYFWFEVPASTYFFSAKRPLTVIYLTSIFETELNLEGGKNYFFRYDEEHPGPDKPAKGAALLVLGPLTQVPDSQALPEIGQTRFMGDGKVLMADEQPQWAPFDFYTDAKPVEKASLDATTKLPKQLRSEAELKEEEDPDGIFQSKAESHWWNPTTWW